MALLTGMGTLYAVREAVPDQIIRGCITQAEATLVVANMSLRDHTWPEGCDAMWVSPTGERWYLDPDEDVWEVEDTGPWPDVFV